MSLTLFRKSLVVLLILAPCLAGALYQGQSPEEVRSELGDPNGTRMLADGEIWVYSGDITLEFRAGRLVRAKGLALEPGFGEAIPSVDGAAASGDERAAATVSPDEPGTAFAETEPGTASTETETGPRKGAEFDKEIDDFSNTVSKAEALAEEMSGKGASAGKGTVTTVFEWLVPVFLTFIFLSIGFKWVGAEASRWVLLLIAAIDKLVMAGVQWVFYEGLGFPTTFHADTLVSFIVMLALITSLTHAKRLPTAIKVVVAAKVATIVTVYLVVLFVLSNM